jgi:hypothetical protein
MNIIAGAFFSASSNAFRRLLSLSPASLDMISGPLIRKKKAPVSLATALHVRKWVGGWVGEGGREGGGVRVGKLHCTTSAANIIVFVGMWWRMWLLVWCNASERARLRGLLKALHLLGCRTT